MVADIMLCLKSSKKFCFFLHFFSFICSDNTVIKCIYSGQIKNRYNSGMELMILLLDAEKPIV